MPAYFFRSEPRAAELRALARGESGRVCQRVLLIANLLEGMEHEEAARLVGLSRSAAYEWHNRYEEDGIEGLRDRPRPGRPPRVGRPGSTRRGRRGLRSGLSPAPSWRGTGWWRFVGSTPNGY
jgi:Winged helix-turn helix